MEEAQIQCQCLTFDHLESNIMKQKNSTKEQQIHITPQKYSKKQSLLISTKEQQVQIQKQNNIRCSVKVNNTKLQTILNYTI